MGRPKLGLPVADGTPLLERPAAALRATCARLRVVGRLTEPVTAPAGFAALQDASPRARQQDTPGPDGHGPLAGLVAALEDGDDGWVLLCAGDLPEVDAVLVAALQDEAERDPARACLPEGARGPEPGFSAWPRARAAEVRARFDAGERALHRALPAEALRRWPRTSWQEIGGADALRNLNTPADWHAWSGEALPEA